MQRHDSLKLSQINEEEPLLEALKKPDDEEQFYTASVQFLKERLQEKCSKLSPRQKTTQSCCNLRAVNRDVCELRKAQSKVKFGFDVPKEPEYALSMSEVLPFPKPKSTKDSFLARITKTFNKYRRCFNTLVETEPVESESMKHYSNFKFPRCERTNKFIDSSRLHNLTERLSRSSDKDVSDTVKTNSEGDFCKIVK